MIIKIITLTPSTLYQIETLSMLLLREAKKIKVSLVKHPHRHKWDGRGRGRKGRGG